MAIPTMEQETVICIGRDDKKARIYTSDTRWMTKLDKVAKRTEVHRQSRAVVAVEYIVPEKWVKINQPRKLSLTEAQKAALSDRLQKGRKEKS